MVSKLFGAAAFFFFFPLAMNGYKFCVNSCRYKLNKFAGASSERLSFLGVLHVPCPSQANFICPLTSICNSEGIVKTHFNTCS